MKYAKRIWYRRLKEEDIPFLSVNLVHDEYQTQVPDCGRRVDREVLVENKNLEFLKSHYEILDVKPETEFLSTITQRVSERALYVAEVQADAIHLAGEMLGTRCPMAGSVLSGHGGLAIGKNWLHTH